MLGGMSGGGMAFFVAPDRQAEFRDQIAAIMRRVKARLDDALPFAMEPVVYDFRINPHGTFADARDRRRGHDAVALLHASGSPDDRRRDRATLDPLRKSDVDHFANHCRDTGELLRVFRTMINNLFPVTRAAAATAAAGWDQAAEQIRTEKASTPSSTSSFARTFSAAGSAWPATACPSTPTSATSTTPT